MSKYDEIKTAADLIAEVAAHGLSTNQEDLNRAADIFGNTAITELDRLANDIGRNNAAGQPDPKGTWTTSRQPTQGTFYSIAFSIWHWSQATAFFNDHTNPVLGALKAELKDLRAERAALIERAAELERSRELRTIAANEGGAQLLKQTVRADTQTRRADAAEANVLQLKAKLYDLMEGK